MDILQDKCTKCGKGLRLENGLKYKTCMRCGNKIEGLKAMKHSMVGGAQQYEKYIEKCDSAIDTCCADEAILYADKALEIYPQSYKAWLCKLKGLCMQKNVCDIDFIEVQACGHETIKYVPFEKADAVKNEVFNEYLAVLRLIKGEKKVV